MQKVFFIDRPRTIAGRAPVEKTIAGKTIIGKTRSSASG
jgi:hypothetical protein